MKTKLKYIIFAFLLFGMGAFSSAKAITADELLVAVQQFAGQVVQKNRLLLSHPTDIVGHIAKAQPTWQLVA